MGQLENSHIHYVVFGFGVSGKPSYKYLKSMGYKVSVVNSGDIETWRSNLAEKEDCYSQESLQAKEVFKTANFIVLSPGIPRNLPELTSSNAEIINDVELFYRHKTSSPKILAVTGSNGKTTSVSLLEEILNQAGIRNFCGGNIGKSPVEFLLSGEKEEVVLLELSSFQLETVNHFHPDVAGLLNVQMTHEERYESIDDYRNAKLRIFRDKKENNFYFCDEENLPFAHGCEIYNSKENLAKLKARYNFKKWVLPGDHNLLNLALCEKMAKAIGVRQEAIQSAINSFKGVKNRIEYLGEIDGVKVYNDSKSTNAYSTMTAMKSFTGKKVALLLGGQIRNHQALNREEINKLSSIAHKILFFGELSKAVNLKADYIVDRLSNLNLNELKEGVDVILFSPGFPSFDEFNNYVERGNCFREIFARAIKVQA